MKKLILFAMLFTVVGVQQMQAQKWLKTLGKVANAALTDDQKKTDAKAKTQASASAGAAVMPGFTVKYTGCTMRGDDAVINFVMNNTSGKEVKLWFDADSNYSYAYDGNNTKHDVSFMIGGEDVGAYTTKNVPAGVPVKGAVCVKNISRDMKNIKGCTVKGKVNETVFVWGVPAQVVQTTKNTNADNIVSSMPELTFNLLKCFRQGNDVVITATLKNTSSNELTIQPKGEVSIYDSEGEAYELNGEACTFGNDHWDSYNYTKLPAGIPVKVKFVIPNVSPSAAEMSIVKLGYETKPNDKKYYFEIRNQAIMAQ